MIYFINQDKTAILGYDQSGNQILDEYRRVPHAEYTEEQKKRSGGGGLKEKKARKGKKWSEDLADLDMPEKKKKSRSSIMPETINKIKVEINAGTALADIARKFGIKYNAVFYLKKQMEDRAKDTIPG